MEKNKFEASEKGHRSYHVERFDFKRKLRK